VDQAAEDLVTSYPRRRQVGDRDCGGGVAIRWPQVSGSVWAMLVIVRDVLLQDRPQVPRPGDQHPVGETLTDCVNPDGQELTEFRWVSLVEADELTGAMIYEPVLINLQQTLHRARM
jgi:hypothetical protein